MSGLPFHAMADGEVVACWRNVPENPKPGELHSGRTPPDLRILGGGNHLWIRHDDGSFALYAHAQPGSIPASLCPNSRELSASRVTGVATDPNIHPASYVPAGVAPDVATGAPAPIGRVASRVGGTGRVVQRPRVRKGQFLGRVGNSGASSVPHLHVHAESGGAPSRAALMRFERDLWTPRTGDNESGVADNNDWRSFSGQKIADGRVLIWPARRLATEYARHKYDPEPYGRLFTHLFNSGFAPVWFDGYQVAERPYFNFVWRPATKQTRAWWGLSRQEFAANLDKGVADGYQPVHVEAYRNGSGMVFAMIMQKGVSGTYLVKHGITEQQHEEWLDEAKKLALNPINVSVTSLAGQRRYTVLYRSNDIGSWQLRSKVQERDHQSLVEEQNGQGRRPSYIAAYAHDGGVYYSVVFASSANGATSLHGLTPDGCQREYGTYAGAGRLTRVVTGVDNHPSRHSLAAVWDK